MLKRSPLLLTASALVRRVPPRQALRDATLLLTVDQELDVVLLSQQLSASGYLRVPVVEDPGSYALRGRHHRSLAGPVASADPHRDVRRSWWASLKVFDPEGPAHAKRRDAVGRAARARCDRHAQDRSARPRGAAQSCATPSIFRPPRRAP